MVSEVNGKSDLPGSNNVDSSKKCSWGPVSSVVPQESRLGPIQFDIPIFNMGKKEDPLSLTSVHSEIMEIMLGVAEKHKDNTIIHNSQHEFQRGRSRLPNLISFYEITQVVDHRKTVDVIFLDFRKAFNTVQNKQNRVR